MATSLILSSFYNHSLPPRTIISSSSPRIRALKFSSNSNFPLTFSFRVAEHHSPEKWKISHDEFYSETPNPDMESLAEPDVSVHSKPNVDRRNLFIILGQLTVPFLCVVVLEFLAKSHLSVHSKPNVERRNWFIILGHAVDSLLGKPWVVPWDSSALLQVSLHLFSSLGFAELVYTAGICIIVLRKESPTALHKALLRLVSDTISTLANIQIFRCLLNRYDPLPPDWFHFSLRGKWFYDVLMGLLIFPLIIYFASKLLPVLTHDEIESSAEAQSPVEVDLVAFLINAMVISVIVPFWEEIIIRGFLLPSLTRYMPVWCSILVSSVVFGLAHGALFFPCTAMGILLGIVYVRSRNLFAPFLLHSLWNFLGTLGVFVKPDRTEEPA